MLVNDKKNLVKMIEETIEETMVVLDGLDRLEENDRRDNYSCEKYNKKI